VRGKDMSEFECCGELMTRNKEGRLTCKVCGGHRAKYMDGKNAKQLAYEDSLDGTEEEEKEDED
jgi:hypothetical protein